MLKQSLKGISIVSLGVFLAKILSLLTFYFIGEYLTEDQIGVYAAVLGVIGILISYQNGGTEPLIVQRRAHKNHNMDFYLSYAVAINFMVFVIALIISILNYKINSTSFFIAIAILVNAVSSAGILNLRSKYIEERNFRKAATIEAFLALVQYAFLIISVLIFESEIAFAISFLMLSLVGFYNLRKIQLKLLSKRLFLALLDKSKWLMLSSFLTGVILNTPYVVLGFLEAKAVVGGFYFVNQSVYSISNLLGRPIQSVVLPILNQYKGLELQLKFSKMLTIFGFIIILGCYIFTFLIQDFVAFIWGDKWIHLSLVFSKAIMAISVRIINVFYWAYTQSKGNWKIRSYMLAMESIVLVITAICICLISDDVVIISQYIYTCLIALSIVSQFYLSRKYSLNTYFLSFIQILVLYGVYFEKI